MGPKIFDLAPKIFEVGASKKEEKKNSNSMQVLMLKFMNLEKDCCVDMLEQYLEDLTVHHQKILNGEISASSKNLKNLLRYNVLKF